MKQEFLCKICKEARTGNAGFFSSWKRFRCATHGMICPDHVESGILSGNHCKVCNKKVLEERWDSNKSRWMKV